MSLDAAISTLDAILEVHRADIGRDFVPYRNHACRMASFALTMVAPRPDATDKVAIAAAFHDLGIWTDHTFDYLEPSVTLAERYLAEHDRTAWVPEISAMIRQHHKVTTYADRPEWLVEPFRRADWIDVTRGLFRFGVPRALIGEAYATWPSAGFHWRLVQLEAGHLRRHPLNPLPVFRW